MCYSLSFHFAGRLHPAGSALLSVEDQGLQLGLALFETMLVDCGHAYFVEAHLERIKRAAHELDIEWPGARAMQFGTTPSMEYL